MPEVVQVEDLIKVVETKFDLEGSLRSAKIRNYTYQGTHLLIDPSNSMLFEFATLQNQFPELYSSPTYKMLLCLGLNQEQNFRASLLNEISRIQKKDNIDKIALWSTVTLDDETIQLLKTMGIDIIGCELPSPEDATGKPMLNFIPIQKRSLEYSLLINYVADYLVKRIKQLFHLVLSEISASIFDEYYGRDKVATEAIMKFEELQLGKLLKRMANENKTGIAVDVGCGTGRHSFMLARTFSQVYAFDFSPQMIQRAIAKKIQLGDTRIIFSVGDFEYERLLDERKFYGKCDLVIASFGMGSFVEDTVKMLRRFQDWLKPGGYIFVSFYNESSILLKLTPSWRDTSLTANIDLETQSLKVELPGSQPFHIFCRPFNEGTRGEINKIFNLDEIYMYPTVMALLPNSLLQDRTAYKLFSYIDDMLADSKRMPKRIEENEPSITDNNYGHYAVVIAHKPQSPISGYSNVMRHLKNRDDIEYEIIEHNPVLSVDDIRHEIGREIDLASVVKTIIFKDAKTDRYIAVSLSAEKMVDKDKLANLFGIPKRRIKFASEKEILGLGFPVGGIAPFGFADTDAVQMVIDAGLRKLKSAWLYMGVGDNKKTLKIDRAAFIRIVEHYTWADL